MERYILIFGALLAFITTASSLSCYSCYDENWNWGSCTINFTLCRNFQDTCASYVAFHIPVKYTPRGERIHHIYKGCDTQESCLKRQDALDQSVCGRTSYDDWSCVECCTGDLCNYYITLDAPSIRVSLTAMILTLTSYLLL